MTNSYFNNHHHRFFFFYGQINDQFCPPTLGYLDFSKLLHQHLRQLGYQRIVFYNSGAQKIDTYDSQSTALVRPNADIQQQTPQRATKICAGPLGQRRQLKKTAQKPQTTPQLTAVNNLDAVAFFKHWMNESQHKTAIIFTNGLDFITHFDQAAQRQMSVALDNWNQLFEENQNICIFLISGISVQRLRELPELQRQWFFLFNQMFKDNDTPTNKMIPIGAPRQDEVNNLLNYWRLKYELPTDWQIFPTAAASITRYLCSQGKSIKDLIRDLRKINTMNKYTLSKLSGQSEEGSALERLRQMNGLSVIADRIERMVTHHQNQIASNSPIAATNIPHNTVSRLLPPPPSPAKGRNLNIALKGNPGTGKTTVARLIGEIYREQGLLELGHIVKASREDLVAGYIGQTALKTAQKIADAMGGVLFVDEAYRLTQGGDNDFGKEAVETIMEAMENHKGEFAVIIAGYPQRIEDFLNANPGLRRRFSDKNTLTIPDYDPQTLQLIFEQQIAKQKRQLDQTLQEKLPNLFANWYAERNEETFGNAGDVLNLYEEMDEHRSFRIKDQADNTLTVADVPERLRPYLEPRQPENLDDILKSLDHLIGLQQVKETVRTLVNRIKVQKLRDDKSQLVPGHYVFVGNPGTGKTTVARLMGNIFKALGILKKGHLEEVGRADLVGQYQGHTAQKTREVLERSMDGVLFIDEAYQLVTDKEHDSFGKEALETLVATMENQRHRLCIIAAGYPEPMHRFINNNPGLPSRFAEKIVFENYTATEMLSIFKGMVQERSLVLGEGVEEALLLIFQQWELENSPTFGNGREVRKLLDAACARMDNRLVKEDVKDKALLHRLERVDIPDYDLSQPENLDDILKSLDHLIGLQQVKETVRTLINGIKVQKQRDDNSQLVPGHYLFVGNPGTGKTTVARLMGNIFKALGILKKGHLEEVGRADLVGQYQGHTAQKTREVLERSMDGVLFIDEAYQLVTDKEHDSFGKEALETLVATMENQRHRLCIIAAGYPEPMHRFVNNNPGLPSRFAEEIVFENYTATEMLSIFKGMVQERSLVLGEGVEEALLLIFQQWELENSTTFGNGRDVRKLLDAACARMDNRLVKEDVKDKALLHRLERVDIPV